MTKKIDNDVFKILREDGVKNIDFKNENNLIYDIKDIIEKNNKLDNWSKRIVNTENNSATIICQMPGQGNRRHYHSNWNEWWYICGMELKLKTTYILSEKVN